MCVHFNLPPTNCNSHIPRLQPSQNEPSQNERTLGERDRLTSAASITNQAVVLRDHPAERSWIAKLKYKRKISVYVKEEVRWPYCVYFVLCKAWRFLHGAVSNYQSRPQDQIPSSLIQTEIRSGSICSTASIQESNPKHNSDHQSPAIRAGSYTVLNKESVKNVLFLQRISPQTNNPPEKKRHCSPADCILYSSLCTHHSLSVHRGWFTLMIYCWNICWTFKLTQESLLMQKRVVCNQKDPSIHANKMTLLVQGK